MKDVARRPNFIARCVSWFLVAMAGTASGQTNASVRFDMPVSHQPLSAYSADQVPRPDLTNSPLLGQLIRDGKLYLSLKDAIRLALENNLDLAIARYNLPIANMDILRTRAGGIFRGVNAGLVQARVARLAAQVERARARPDWCNLLWARALQLPRTIPRSLVQLALNTRL